MDTDSILSLLNSTSPPLWEIEGENENKTAATESPAPGAKLDISRPANRKRVVTFLVLLGICAVTVGMNLRVFYIVHFKKKRNTR